VEGSDLMQGQFELNQMMFWPAFIRLGLSSITQHSYLKLY
jgi:hypothetical protein